MGYTISKYNPSGHIVFIQRRINVNPINDIALTLMRRSINVIFPLQQYHAGFKLEMCQYDTGAPAQGHPYPHAGILQKMKLKKGP